MRCSEFGQAAVCGSEAAQLASADVAAVSVAASEKAVAVVTVQYKGGLVDFNRVSLIEQNLVQQQLQLAQAQANIAIGLVQLYRAMGGGWEMRMGRDTPAAELPQAPPPAPQVEPLKDVPPVPALPKADVPDAKPAGKE